MEETQAIQAPTSITYKENNNLEECSQIPEIIKVNTLPLSELADLKTLMEPESLSNDKKIEDHELISLKNFLKLISTKSQNYSDDNIISDFKNYGDTYGIAQKDETIKVLTRPESQQDLKNSKEWYNWKFPYLYTRDLYKRVNRELRRFDAFYKRQNGMVISKLEEVDLESKVWSPISAIDELWSNFIIGCLKNFTPEKRNLSESLSRGYLIPSESLTDYAKQFYVGKVFYWAGFISASTGTGFEGNVQVNINPLGDKTVGVEIAHISAYPEEQEVLFPPFTWFQVSSIDLTDDNLSMCVNEYPFNYFEEFFRLWHNVRPLDKPV